ncbi:MAG: hypothetical protein NTX50_02775 [Candidatus Sumerlaeota bacterium]|nr:hypothetical protein [Candidatus Sumerlaeota bacterium]
MADTPKQVFHFSLSFRLSMLASAGVCIAMAILALILPWTPAFKPIEPSPDITAILISTLVFLPLTGFFIHRCNRFWGYLEVGADGITIYTLTRHYVLPFEQVVRVSIAGSEGAHELVLISEGRWREVEILTQHLNDEQRFMQIVKAGLRRQIEEQNALWDKGEMTCEYSPRAIREGWYFATVVNGMAWVVAGSIIWRHYANPMVIASTIAGLAAVAGLSVMIHQRFYNCRFTLTHQGMAMWSVLGNRFVSYFNIQMIRFSHREARRVRHIRCEVHSPEGRWTLTSTMGNFEGFVSRLTQRAVNATVRGAPAINLHERNNVIRIRALKTMWFWFVASLFVALVLAGWGGVALSERWYLIKHGSMAVGTVKARFHQDKEWIVTYEFPAGVSRQPIYQGQASVSESAFGNFQDGGFISVLYDPQNPDWNLYEYDISHRFNWIFVLAGVALFGYACYQMRLIWLERRTAGKAPNKRLAAEDDEEEEEEDT